VSDEPQLSPHAAHNRRMWDADSSDYQSIHGPQLAASGGTAWGVWQLPESELRVLGDVRGKDVLELGCGAAQWSIALHAIGARVTGLDNSSVQLGHARELMAQADVDFPLVHASAESTPFADASFDVVFCDHGAMAFADPYRTVPEAARLLRADGLLAFSMNTPILDLVWPLADAHPGERLTRDYWDLGMLQAADEPVEFQLPYGAWIALFADHGFDVESLIELRPPPQARSSYRDEHDLAWARRWPMEHIWRVRRTRAAQA
jgi:SAM-dependent methyltransferase